MKKLVFLAVLLGGLAWQAHSRGWVEGSPLSLHPSLTLDFNDLTYTTSEAELRALYPGLYLQCAAEPTPLGHRVCWTPLRKWNGIYTRTVAFFFTEQDRLGAVRLGVRASEYEAAVTALRGHLGESRPVPGQRGESRKPLRAWNAKRGLVVTDVDAGAHVAREGERVVLWLAKARLLESAVSGR